MEKDAFSRYHPLVNFLFFMAAIGFCVVVQHPAYMTAGCLCGGIYYWLLCGRKGRNMIGAMIPTAILIAGINPLFNHYGHHILFTVFGNPYTLEALIYGTVIAGMFVSMMIWFGCYSAVLTSDKFTSLFGNLIPALSLLLVMVLRLIPNFIQKAHQISGARRSIGKGVSTQNTFREKLQDGACILSALTDWALEGSIVTADSMRARGYGCCKRSNFQIFRFSKKDCLLLCLMLFLIVFILIAGGMNATFTPVWHVDSITWGFPLYCAFLLIPSIISCKEAIIWHFMRSKI